MYTALSVRTDCPPQRTFTGAGGMPAGGCGAAAAVDGADWLPAGGGGAVLGARQALPATSAARIPLSSAVGPYIAATFLGSGRRHERRNCAPAPYTPSRVRAGGAAPHARRHEPQAGPRRGRTERL